MPECDRCGDDRENLISFAGEGLCIGCYANPDGEDDHD